MNDIDLYKEWRDNLLEFVSDSICKPCDSPQKDDSLINYDNPLQCPCLCQRVEGILNNAREIHETIISSIDH